MTTLSAPQLMTTEELLALPDDGIDRDLSQGRLRERDLTRRGRRHTRAGAAISELLRVWLGKQPEPRGEVLVGEAAFQLRRDPDTTVGIDVAYISAATAAANSDDVFIIDGIPVLAVEIVSPSDKMQDVLEKVGDYLDAGVPLVWIAEPVFRTVTVFRPDAEPELFNARQQLRGDPHMPGFSVSVNSIFGG
jgi:Uma2 family endonuclease